MQCNYTILFQTLVRGAVITIRPPASSIGDRKHMTADLLQPAQGHSPRPVLQELVAGIVAGWTKLLVHLPPWSSLACGLAGVHDSVVNESVQPDKRVSTTRGVQYVQKFAPRQSFRPPRPHNTERCTIGPINSNE